MEIIRQILSFDLRSGKYDVKEHISLISDWYGNINGEFNIIVAPWFPISYIPYKLLKDNFLGSTNNDNEYPIKYSTRDKIVLSGKENLEEELKLVLFFVEFCSIKKETAFTHKQKIVPVEMRDNIILGSSFFKNSSNLDEYNDSLFIMSCYLTNKWGITYAKQLWKRLDMFSDRIEST